MDRRGRVATASELRTKLLSLVTLKENDSPNLFKKGFRNGAGTVICSMGGARLKENVKMVVGSMAEPSSLFSSLSSLCYLLPILPLLFSQASG